MYDLGAMQEWRQTILALSSPRSPPNQIESDNDEPPKAPRLSDAIYERIESYLKIDAL